MAKLTDEHKQEMGNYFELGIHIVDIKDVVQAETDDKREYFEFTVTAEDDDSLESTARLWFHTDKAIKYSFSIVRGIFTANAPEGKEEAVKAELQKIDDTDELIKLCKKALKGKKAWLEVSEDPTRTYEKDGEQKPSINRNITGYEPQPKKVAAPAASAPAQPANSDSDENVMANF